MKIFDVTIKGIAPLMQARHPSPDDAEKITKLSKNKKAVKKALTNKEQFEMHAYKTKSKKFYQPSEMIEATMAKAATNFRYKGQKSYKEFIIGGILAEPDKLVHKKQNFTADSRWAVNKRVGAVWVVRPRIDKWELSFKLQLLQDERVPVDVLQEILEYAGLYVGIGSWRPKFGRFEVTKFMEVTK